MKGCVVSFICYEKRRLEGSSFKWVDILFILPLLLFCLSLALKSLEFF